MKKTKKTKKAIINLILLGALFSGLAISQINIPMKDSRSSEYDTVQLGSNRIEPLNDEMPIFSGNHAPILINGNADFATQAAANGWSGAGTVGDPYVIENLEINTDIDGQSAIYINNTDVFFIAP